MVNKNLSSTDLSESNNYKTRFYQLDQVYVQGLPYECLCEEVLKSKLYFGQYGEVQKVCIKNKIIVKNDQNEEKIVYETYIKYESVFEASLAIFALD